MDTLLFTDIIKNIPTKEISMEWDGAESRFQDSDFIFDIESDIDGKEVSLEAFITASISGIITQANWNEEPQFKETSRFLILDLNRLNIDGDNVTGSLNRDQFAKLESILKDSIKF